MRMTNGQARQIAGSAGDVKDRADLPSLEARDQPAGLFCWDRDEVNVSARRLRHHLGHDRQRAVGPGADDQPGSAPRELLVGRERSVSELVAIWLRGLLAPFAHGTSVNDDVVLVRSSVDLDRPEPEESHIHHVPPYPSVGKSNHLSVVWFSWTKITTWPTASVIYPGFRVDPHRSIKTFEKSSVMLVAVGGRARRP
jgi:hypothetical protein